MGTHTADEPIVLDDVSAAIADIKAGKAVVVVDDEDRENEGDLIFAAELATPELVSFMVRYSSGYICVGMPNNDCDRLGLPPMVARNEDVRGTAYTVTVDAAEGVDTGISAIDRARTISLWLIHNPLLEPSTARGTLFRYAHAKGRARSPGTYGSQCRPRGSRRTATSWCPVRDCQRRRPHHDGTAT